MDNTSWVRCPGCGSKWIHEGWWERDATHSSYILSADYDGFIIQGSLEDLTLRRTTMATIERKSLNQPEEINKPEKLKMEVITIRGFTIRRITVEPGWQWSKHLKHIQKTESCQKDG